MLIKLIWWLSQLYIEAGGLINSPYILSAGIIPVNHENGNRLYLLLRAYNHWDFPKGIVDESETPWHAALRELQEETGIKKINPLSGQEYYETTPYSTGKIARYYLAEVFSKDVVIEPNPQTGIKEHQEYKWLSYSDARKLIVPRVQYALDWAESKMVHHQKELLR
ncbi:MAG: NUDIX domain-containing protein [Bdellovibrio sp.]